MPPVSVIWYLTPDSNRENPASKTVVYANSTSEVKHGSYITHRHRKPLRVLILFALVARVESNHQVEGYEP